MSVIDDLLAEVNALPPTTPSDQVHKLYQAVAEVWRVTSTREREENVNELAYEAILTYPSDTRVRIIDSEWGMGGVRGKIGTVIEVEKGPWFVVAHVNVGSARIRIPSRRVCEDHETCLQIHHPDHTRLEIVE